MNQSAADLQKNVLDPLFKIGLLDHNKFPGTIDKFARLLYTFSTGSEAKGANADKFSQIITKGFESTRAKWKTVKFDEKEANMKTPGMDEEFLKFWATCVGVYSLKDAPTSSGSGDEMGEAFTKEMQHQFLLMAFGGMAHYAKNLNSYLTSGQYWDDNANDGQGVAKTVKVGDATAEKYFSDNFADFSSGLIEMHQMESGMTSAA